MIKIIKPRYEEIAHYFETPKGAAVASLIVCMGTAVVLLGALFKITHWPGATVMLIDRNVNGSSFVCDVWTSSAA